MSYKYVKAPPGYTLHRPASFIFKLRILFSMILLTSGVTALTSVVYPMLVYHVTYAGKIKNTPSPVTTVEASEPTFLPEMINTTFDYTDSTTWFRQTKPTLVSSQADIIYTLDIPKLGIENATVRNDHTDLKKTLIHYPGTALPGELGNTVIFGHSVLPQFFNPKNYTSIFSTLHTLEKGDEMIVRAEGATYTYRITDMYSVNPDNLTPLSQSYDTHRLTLITCTPPGTYLKRLIIKAELI